MCTTPNAVLTLYWIWSKFRECIWYVRLHCSIHAYYTENWRQLYSTLPTATTTTKVQDTFKYLQYLWELTKPLMSIDGSCSRLVNKIIWKGCLTWKITWFFWSCASWTLHVEQTDSQSLVWGHMGNSSIFLKKRGVSLEYYRKNVTSE